MQKRAKIGGEVALNGEFYHGGEFLPTTQMASQHRGKAAPKARKQNVEGYTWDFAPVAGQIAIYPQLSGTMQYDRNTNTFSVFAPYYSKLDAAQQQRFDDLIARFNRGERWV